MLLKEKSMVNFDCRVEDIEQLLSAIVQLQQLENFVWIINERALINENPAIFDGEKKSLN